MPTHNYRAALATAPYRYHKAKRGGDKELIDSCEKADYNNYVLLSKEYIVSKHKTTIKRIKVMAKSLNSFDSAIANYMSANSVRSSFMLGLHALRAALIAEDSDILSPIQISRAVWGFALWASCRPSASGDGKNRTARIFFVKGTSQSNGIVYTSVAGGKTFLNVATCEYTQTRISSLWASFLNIAKQDTKHYPWASAFVARKQSTKLANNVRAAVASASENTLLAALAAKKGISVEALKALLG